jgi:hypothetical protein
MSDDAAQPLDQLDQLERDTAALLACARGAEEAGTAGRQRAALQRDARRLQERGTMVLLQIDAMGGGEGRGIRSQSRSGSAAQLPEEKQRRDALFRAERKRLAVRVQSCSTRLSPFL